jgi:hypothetical protein
MIFLAAGIGAVVLAALWRGFGGYAPAKKPFKYLSRMDAAVIEAAAEATFPKGGDVTPSYADARVVEYCDDYIMWLPASQRILIRLLFVLFEHATIVFVPSLRRMSSLSLEARVKYLEDWDQSPIYLRRMAFQSLRAILCMAYLADDEVNRQIGNVRTGACAENNAGRAV